MRRLSLRGRLSIAVGLVIVAVCTLVGFVVIVAVQRQLIDDVDDQLAFFAEQQFASPTNAGPLVTVPPPVTEAGGVGGPPFSFVLLDRDGSIRGSFSGGFEDDPESLPDLSGLSADDFAALSGQIVDLTATDGGPVRGVITRDRSGFLVLTVPTARVEALTDAIQLIVGVITVGAASIGTVGAWWVLRRGFRPIDGIIDTAESIAAGQRGRRLASSAGSRTEIGRLSAALNDMLTSLEQADAARAADAERIRRFVDDASHELRTPITAIVGYTELLNEAGTDDPALLDRAVAAIGQAGVRAERLIDALLALAHLDQGIGIERHPVDLTVVLQDLADDHRLTSGRTILVDLPPHPTPVEGDGLWLGQAVDNLLRNALAYSPPDTPVTVRLDRCDQQVGVAIVDHGPGIPVDMRERIFDRFSRLDQSRTRADGGAGLGLAIVHEVVQAHAGHVAVTDTVGGGTTVTITLPVLAPVAGDQLQSASAVDPRSVHDIHP